MEVLVKLVYISREVGLHSLTLFCSILAKSMQILQGGHFMGFNPCSLPFARCSLCSLCSLDELEVMCCEADSHLMVFLSPWGVFRPFFALSDCSRDDVSKAFISLHSRDAFFWSTLCPAHFSFLWPILFAFPLWLEEVIPSPSRWKAYLCRTLVHWTHCASWQ